VSLCLVDVSQAGLGRHAAAVAMEDPRKINRFFFLLYLLDWFYVPSNMLSRVSVVVLYLRIFVDRWARAACWAVIAFLVANCVAAIIAAQLECIPLQYTWDKDIPGGSCFNQILWYQLVNFPNILGDVLVMLLPTRTVWTLKSSWVHRAGIAVVCLTGSIGIIASTVRTSVFYLDADLIATDPTFTTSAFVWTVIECGFYFSAACLVGLRPLINRIPCLAKHRTKASSGDDIQLKTFHNSRYKNMNEVEDIMQMPIQPSVTTLQHAQRSPFNDHASGGDILVETSVNVWK
jgi:hypothetical protein